MNGFWKQRQILHSSGLRSWTTLPTAISMLTLTLKLFNFNVCEFFCPHKSYKRALRCSYYRCVEYVNCFFRQWIWWRPVVEEHYQYMCENWHPDWNDAKPSNAHAAINHHLLHWHGKTEYQSHPEPIWFWSLSNLPNVVAHIKPTPKDSPTTKKQVLFYTHKLNKKYKYYLHAAVQYLIQLR